MKIARVQKDGQIHLALVDEAKQEVALVGGPLAQHPNPVLDVIQLGVSAAQLQAAVTARVPMAQVKFMAPLSAFLRNPFAVGKNYHEHAMEFDKSGFNATSGGASAIPAFPQIFTKATLTLNGPTDPIQFNPKHTQSVDYEGEIGVVIGTTCRNVSKADAMKQVWGFVATERRHRARPAEEPRAVVPGQVARRLLPASAPGSPPPTKPPPTCHADLGQRRAAPERPHLAADLRRAHPDRTDRARP